MPKPGYTRQGVRDLDGPGRNGHRTRPVFWNRERHQPEAVFDDFGRFLGTRCSRCRERDPDPDKFCT